MPYDRPFTAMAPFPLCSPCEAEFRDPADRRFSRPAGGLPRLRAATGMAGRGGNAGRRGGAAGGYRPAGGGRHRGDKKASAAFIWPAMPVTPLPLPRCGRAEKHRPAKPLAVMLPTATGLPAAAAALMGSPAAPIVLIAKAQVSGLCDEIAPGLAEVGVMLPFNPLQHLLLQGWRAPS